MRKIESIFRLIEYDYVWHNKRKLRYPTFRVVQREIMYFKTLDEVEAYMQRVARYYLEDNNDCPKDDFYVDVYAYVVIEHPLGVELMSSRGDNLSTRVYGRDGILWGKNQYANFFPRFCSKPDEFNYWGRQNMFLGREPEEIRFKPGDIVEIFGYPGNVYWSEDEVNLAIIVNTPPTVTEVSAMREKYLDTHSGFDLCDHAQSTIFDRHLDAYEVISSCFAGIDHASTISVFEPTKKVSARRHAALRDMYEKFKEKEKRGEIPRSWRRKILEIGKDS